MKKTSLWKILGINLLVFVILALLVFLSLEIYLRVNHKITDKTESAVGVKIFQNDENLAYSHLPGAYDKNGYGNPTPEIFINEYGFRDSSHQAELSEQKVLVLGDSFTFSTGLSYEDSFVYKLGQLMGETWTTLNAGVIGYTLDNEYLLLKKVYDQLKPDLVIVNIFVANDITEFRRHEWVKDGDDLVAVKDTEILVNDKHTLDRKVESEPFSYAYKFFLDSFKILALKYDWKSSNSTDYTLTWPVFLAEDHEGYDPRVPDFYNKLFEMMLKMQTFTETKGSKLAFVIIPMDVQVSEVYWPKYAYVPSLFDEEAFAAQRPQNKILEFCQNNSLDCLDLLPEFLASDQKDTLYFSQQSDPHFDKAGHELTADLIYTFLKNTNLYE